MVKSFVDTGDDSMYTKVLKAAETRDDETMLVHLREVPSDLREVPIGDLAVAEAQYHRKKTYVNPKVYMQLKSSQRTSPYMIKHYTS